MHKLLTIVFLMVIKFEYAGQVLKLISYLTFLVVM